MCPSAVDVKLATKRGDVATSEAKQIVLIEATTHVNVRRPSHIPTSLNSVRDLLPELAGVAAETGAAAATMGKLVREEISGS